MGKEEVLRGLDGLVEGIRACASQGILSAQVAQRIVNGIDKVRTKLEMATPEQLDSEAFDIECTRELEVWRREYLKAIAPEGTKATNSFYR